MATSVVFRMIAGLMVIGVLAVDGPASGQESPDVMTRAESRCQSSMSTAAGDMGSATATCFAECRARATTDSARQCDPFTGDGLDGKTLACLQIARARSVIDQARACGGSSCPECYARGNCAQFGDQVLSSADSFMRSEASSIFCNDDGSGDGLTPAEARCQQGAFRGLAKLYDGIGKCLAHCQRSRARSETSCSIGDATPPLDARAQRCVDRARKQFLDRCGRRCGDQPECWFSSCEDVFNATMSQFDQFDMRPLSCFDRTTCGDGFVTGDEQCETGLFPNGCSGTAPYCNNRCRCEPSARCRDGIVSGGEACDPTATPTGCATGLVCAFGCSFCTTPFCGDGVVTAPEQCEQSVPGTCGPDQLCDSGCSCQTVVNQCSAAQLLDIPSGGGTVTGVTSGFGGQQASCGGGSSPERAYRWTPAASGLATVDSCDPGNFFHAMTYVRRDACIGGLEVACAQHSSPAACSNGNHGGLVQFQVTAGTTYYVFIDGSSGESGSYTLRVTAPVASPSGAFVE
jgi:hypothetical protein